MATTDVNPYKKHLSPNQYCSLQIDFAGNHLWLNPDGLSHRVDESGVQDGPALIWKSGTQAWCLKGEFHRLDGPAVSDLTGTQAWYLDGIPMTQEQWASDPRVIEYHSMTQLGAEEWVKQL